MEAVGGPDAKKARWSPTSFNGNGLPAPNPASAAGARADAFANYGYGPQAGMSANGFSNSPPSSGFPAAAGNAAGALYSTPTLSVNTAVATNGMGQQMSPNTAYTPQNQQPPSATPNSANPYNFNGYNMLGMGLPGMNVLGGFPYNGQMAATFTQVCVFTLSISAYAKIFIALSICSLRLHCPFFGFAVALLTACLGWSPASCAVPDVGMRSGLGSRSLM